MLNLVTSSNSQMQIQRAAPTIVEKQTPIVVEPPKASVAEIADTGPITEQLTVTDTTPGNASETFFFKSLIHDWPENKLNSDVEVVDELTGDNAESLSPPTELSRIIQELNHTLINKDENAELNNPENELDGGPAEAQRSLNMRF